MRLFFGCLLCVLTLFSAAQTRVLVLNPVVVEGTLNSAEQVAIRSQVAQGLAGCDGLTTTFEGNYAAIAQRFQQAERLDAAAAGQLQAESGADYALFTAVRNRTQSRLPTLSFDFWVVSLPSAQTQATFSYQTNRSGYTPEEARSAILEKLPEDIQAAACDLFAELTGTIGASDSPARPATTVGPLPEAGKEVATLINQVRKNPAAFSKPYGVNLGYLVARPALVWNDVLAEVATRKAEDMYRRQYFDHVDPDGTGINILIHEAGYTLVAGLRKTRSMNTFESISAGYTDPAAIVEQLIVDQGVNPPGHRHHLLGHEDFWGNCTDIGVGVYATDDRYGGYCVIIIAKHDF